MIRHHRTLPAVLVAVAALAGVTLFSGAATASAQSGGTTCRQTGAKLLKRQGQVRVAAKRTRGEVRYSVCHAAVGRVHVALRDRTALTGGAFTLREVRIAGSAVTFIWSQQDPGRARTDNALTVSARTGAALIQLM